MKIPASECRDETKIAEDVHHQVRSKPSIDDTSY